MSFFKRSVAALCLGVAALFSSNGCTLSSVQIEMQRAEQAEQKGEYERALQGYERILGSGARSEAKVQAARQAAKLNQYQLQRYKEAIGFYRQVILQSGNSEERIFAQKQIADILFNQILDYQQAIIEFSRLLNLPHSTTEGFQYRMAIARSYFYLNNFYQAQVEVERILASNHSPELLFDPLLLKANALLNSRKHEEAIQVLRELMTKYPERSKAETIGLTLAVTYEEQKNFTKAIETLQALREIYPRKDFIDNRIKVLKERQSHLPGARGLRK